MSKLSAPANQAEIEQFQGACKQVDAAPADTLRKLAKAFAEHVQEHGYFVMPIRFAPPPKKDPK